MILGRRVLSRTFKRMYIVPKLEQLSREQGIPGVLSVEGLKCAWFDRAEHYVDRLNQVSTDSDGRSLEANIRELADVSSKKQIYSYSSLLYNLKFAFSVLHGNSGTVAERPIASSGLLQTPKLTLEYANEPLQTGNERLHQALLESFGSIVEFRSLLLNSNLAISGDGYTWLVAKKSNAKDALMETEFDKLFILNTYNAGSPFTVDRTHHFQRAAQQNSSELHHLPEEATNKNTTTTVTDAAVYKKSTVYIPLLAIDASPKTWLHDYGVFGKQEYLDKIWESIEWGIVESRLPKKSSRTSFMF
ncbi:mitochondrial 37S ribosomal protein mS43 Ecym_1321 [Eremothecium cymbalariae DBVPG|uniref:Manganese/iron superoxide dismutase C-terminal domain-containing protein n=1 Tax=Eremothecium cymbalariae (strain CBS 270.75 / DBVPG 7215 / KCTC 17166 / NRRL Y-17582) TaxID=931890 RepID=G8JN92_ERECY|nr:hypothetical protein Ecym_1321 [Eremothecium cymbalariae DBVPG\